MVRLDRPTREEFDRWFAVSIQRQAEDRAWVNGTDPKRERASLDEFVPVLLPQGPDTADHAFRIARDASGRELGFVWFGVFPGLPDDALVLFDLFVHEGNRGKGVGRAILEPMLVALKADGIREVILYVRADNAPARALYRRLGFTEDEAPSGARDLTMRKRLSDGNEDEACAFERQDVVIEDVETPGFILDIGGGGGGVIGQAFGSRVVAVDRLKEELEETPDGPLKVVADARELPFLDGSFPVATSFFTLMYVNGEDHPRVFGEIFRVLAAGGRFLVWEPILPPRGESSQNVAVVPVTAQLPRGEMISNFYGTRWPSESRDPAYYRRVAEEAGLEVVTEEVRKRYVMLELRKP